MAEKGTGDTTALDNILQCQICHNKLKAPQTLKQCLHSFCKSCLEAMPKKTTDGKEGWFCPQCNTFSGEDEIDADFFVSSLLNVKNNSSDVLEATDKAVVCEQCDGDSEVSGKCTDCKIALCEKCKSLHLKIPLLKGHKIIPFNQEANEGRDVIDDLIFCSLHHNRVNELNCKPCGKVICMMCKATDHESHQTELITTALHGIETNTAQISENIEAIKAQIECVKSKIEETKEAYACCRLRMDDHLEKVISRIRAMKASLEDDVTEHESMALDILNGMKQNLENQLSKATNIVNLVSATKVNYRDVSLLTTMHGGLYAKVNNLGNQEQNDIDVQIQQVIFKESNNIKATFSNIFGDVEYEEESTVIDPSGKIIQLQYMCDSFQDLLSNTFSDDLNIHLPNWANRLSYVDDQIWVPLRDDNLISVYNLQGEPLESVETVESVTVVKKAHNGNIIAGGDDGLYVVSEDWSEWSQISEGKFSDIIVQRNTFSALDYSSKDILTFSYSTSNNMWTEVQNITIEDIQGTSFSNTISSFGETFVVSDTAKKNIVKYNQNGYFLKSESFESPLCFAGTDKSGKVLTTNFQNGSLHLLDITSEELSLPNIGDIKCPKLRDVIIDREQNVWCLRGNASEFTVVKFVMEK